MHHGPQARLQDSSQTGLQGWVKDQQVVLVNTLFIQMSPDNSAKMFPKQNVKTCRDRSAKVTKYYTYLPSSLYTPSLLSDVPKRECSTVPREKCENVPVMTPRQVCNNVPREVCKVGMIFVTCIFVFVNIIMVIFELLLYTIV